MDITVRAQRIKSPLKHSDVERAVVRMLRHLGVRRVELSVVFLDACAMRRLNRRYLGHDRVTDVIAFDLKGQQTAGSSQQSSARRQLPATSCRLPSVDGEIFICPAEARRNAKLYGEPLRREVLRYLAHGILHLLGFDDSTALDRERMGELEDNLLGHLGTRDTRHKTQG